MNPSTRPTFGIWMATGLAADRNLILKILAMYFYNLEITMSQNSQKYIIWQSGDLGIKKPCKTKKCEIAI